MPSYLRQHRLKWQVVPPNHASLDTYLVDAKMVGSIATEVTHAGDSGTKEHLLSVT